jgi:hypothetical protein
LTHFDMPSTIFGSHVYNNVLPKPIWGKSVYCEVENRHDY